MPKQDVPPTLGKDGRPLPLADLLPGLQPSAWRVERPLVLLHAELGRSLSALGEVPALLALVERWRDATNQDRLVQAVLATALADGMLIQTRIDQAVDLADLAEGILQQLLADTEGRTPERRLALALLEPVRTAAHRRQDVDRYGAAWVAYREADRALMSDHDPFLAQVRYARIEQEFPGGLIALAARANRLVLQITCARSDRLDDRLAWLDLQQADLAVLIAAATNLQHQGIGNPETVARQQSLLNVQKESLAALARWPSKPAQAGARALEEAHAFIAEDPDGLYRCDVLMATADWAWEEEADALNGGRQYEQVAAWLERVPKRDAAIDGFDFDGRIRTVAAPAPAPLANDEWGNLTWSGVAPGTILNHRTCPWLARRLGMRANAKAGLCAFSRGDRKAALAALDRMAGQDPFEDLRRAGNTPVSNVSRLRDGFATGRMFATAEELALFQGRERAALITAELAFECEEWVVALNAYRSVLERFGPRLKPEQQMYVEFMIALSMLSDRQGDRDAAVVILRRLSLGPETAPTWWRVEEALFDYLRWFDPTKAEAFAILDRVLASRCSEVVKDRFLWLKSFLTETHGDPKLIAQQRAWWIQLTSSPNPSARGQASASLAYVPEQYEDENGHVDIVRVVAHLDEILASSVTGLDRDQAMLTKACILLYEYADNLAEGRALLIALDRSSTPWMRRAAASMLETFPEPIPDPAP